MWHVWLCVTYADWVCAEIKHQWIGMQEVYTKDDWDHQLLYYNKIMHYVWLTNSDKGSDVVHDREILSRGSD